MGGRMGGCEPRIEVIVKMKSGKNKSWGSGGGVVGGGVGWGWWGDGSREFWGCEPRIEGIVKRA